MGEMPQALSLVESFLNSVDVESGSDDFDSPERYEHWLRRHAQPGTGATEADIAQARMLRDALRAAAYAHHDRAHPAPARLVSALPTTVSADPLRVADPMSVDAADRVDAETGGPAARVALAGAESAHGTGGDVGYAAMLDRLAGQIRLRARFGTGGVGLESGEDGVRTVLGSVLAAVVLAAGDGTWPRVKICREDTCQWVFFDQSKNSSRQWCSMRVCGNRNKTRAYRSRQHS